jgi:DNA-binding LacI/PurR family transcriptional regulator
MSVRLEDIAKKTGVSVMTVSRALRGIGRMKAETRTRIREAAVKMGYSAMSTVIIPSPTLSSKADYVLRLLAPTIRYPISADVGGWFLDRMVEGTRHRLEISNGTMESHHFDTLEQTLDYIREKRFQGVVILQPLPDAWVRRLCDAVAVVCLSEDSMYTSEVDTVRSNEAHATARILGELERRGHRNIAWFGVLDRNQPTRDFSSEPGVQDDRSLSSVQVARYGVWAVMEKVKSPHVRNKLYLEDRDWACQELEEVVTHALDKILAETDRPTAVVCYSDPGAIEVYRQLVERGFRIPDDISLVSCGSRGSFPDDIPVITSTVTPVEQIGQVVPELIERRLANPDATPIGIRLENTWCEGETLKDLSATSKQ